MFEYFQLGSILRNFCEHDHIAQFIQLLLGLMQLLEEFLLDALEVVIDTVTITSNFLGVLCTQLLKC